MCREIHFPCQNGRWFHSAAALFRACWRDTRFIRAVKNKSRIFGPFIACVCLVMYDYSDTAYVNWRSVRGLLGIAPNHQF